MIKEVDEDGSGQVDFPEILSLLARKMKDHDTESQVMDAFKVFDREGNQGISIDDLQRVMANLGDKLSKEELEFMIREADADGNGVIDDEEFVAMMMAK